MEPTIDREDRAEGGGREWGTAIESWKSKKAANMLRHRTGYLY
jgi:hypothetical protein